MTVGITCHLIMAKTMQRSRPHPIWDSLHLPAALLIKCLRLLRQKVLYIPLGKLLAVSSLIQEPALWVACSRLRHALPQILMSLPPSASSRNMGKGMTAHPRPAHINSCHVQPPVHLFLVRLCLQVTVRLRPLSTILQFRSFNRTVLHPHLMISASITTRIYQL